MIDKILEHFLATNLTTNVVDKAVSRNLIRSEELTRTNYASWTDGVSVVTNGSSNQATPLTTSVVTNESSNQIPSPPARNQSNFLKLRGVPIFQFRKPNQATSKTQISANPIETSQDSSRVRANNRSARKLPKFPGCIVS